MRNTILLISAAFVSLLVGCSSEPSGDYAKSSAPTETRLANQTDGDTKLAPVQINLTNREVVRTGEIDVRVDDVEAAEKKAQAIVKEAGGFVSDSATSNLASERSSLNMTVRIPVASFDNVLASFASLGTVGRKATAATDVTG